MCKSAQEWIRVRSFSRKLSRTRVRVLRLSSLKKRRDEGMGEDLELKNLELYMKNMSIFEENEKLRKKAAVLYQENIALMSELIKRSIKCLANNNNVVV